MPLEATLKTPRRFGVVFLFILCSCVFLQAEELIDHVVITGQHPLSEKKVEAITTALKGKEFSPGRVQAASERIRRECMASYYPLASVKWKAIPVDSASGVLLNFAVEQGPKGRLREVRIQGNTLFSTEELLSILQVTARESWWPALLRNDILNLDKIEEDRQNLLLEYYKQGYAGVEIEPALLERHPELDGFRLTWNIVQEGDVYGVGTISFDADLLPPREVVERLMPLESDERYNAEKVEAARKSLQRYLYENGHAFVKVDVVEERLPDVRRVNILFKVRAGRRPVLRNIEIVGQTNTKPAFIRNEISIAEGDLFDPKKIEESKLRLDQLPVFSRVEMNIEGVPEASVFDLRIWVRERKTGRAEAGVVYGDAEGAALQFNLMERNLDLIPPFRGGGYEGGLSATLGSEVVRGEVQITDPRVGSTDWSMHFQLFYEDSEVVSDFYNEKSYGGQVLGAHPLSENWVGSIGFSILNSKLSDINRDVLTDLNEIDEDMRLTSLVGFLGYDTTDESFRPTQGLRGRIGANLGTEMLGGNVDAIQATFKSGAFYRPYGDHVVSLRLGYDSVQPYGDTEQTPQALKQYLGGGQTLRGFEYRSVSVLDEAGRPIGGETRWWASVEYLLPIMPQRMDLAFFYDIGDVSLESNSFSGEGPVSNVGLGLAVRADNFPVRFNVAMPLETYENDQINEKGDIYLSFTVGYFY